MRDPLTQAATFFWPLKHSLHFQGLYSRWSCPVCRVLRSLERDCPACSFFFFFLNHQVRREKAACSIALSDGYSGGLWPPKTWLQMGLLSSCCSHETKAFSVWATPTPLHSGNFFVLRNRAVIVTLPCSFGPSRSQDPVTLFLNIIEHPLQRAFANIWVISMDAYHIRNENILAL